MLRLKCSLFGAYTGQIFYITEEASRMQQMLDGETHFLFIMSPISYKLRRYIGVGLSVDAYVRPLRLHNDVKNG